MEEKFDKLKIINLLVKMQKNIKDSTEWFDERIGNLISIKDMTIVNPDDDILLSEIFLRSIEFEIKLEEKFIANPEIILERVNLKKLILLDMVKDTHLDNHLINPEIVSYDSTEGVVTFAAKLPLNWRGNIAKHFKNHWMTKCDVNKYFEYDTLMHINDGLATGSIVSSEVLEILIGNKKYSQKQNKSGKSRYSKDLDSSKKKAFNAAISNNGLTIIKGPPGTGKSHLIARLIEYFVYEDKSKVIVSSRTHSALDNIVERLSVTDHSENYTGIMLEKSSYKNINSNYTNPSKMIAKNIRNRLLEKLPKDSLVRKHLKTTFSKKVGAQRFLGTENEKLRPSVFLGTITSAKLETNIKKKGYDFNDSILIMDEVSKSSIIDVLRYATYAKKIILVGDDMQLSPIIDDSIQIKSFKKTLSDKELDLYNHLFSENIFEKLYSDNSKSLVLMETYRSPQYILNLYNFLAYENKITTNVKTPPKIVFKKTQSEKKMQELYKFNTVIVDDPNAFHSRNDSLSERSKINMEEMNTLLEHLSYLSKNIENKDDVSIMVSFFYKDQFETFYRNYNNKIKYYEKRFKSFTYGTVDQLQGKEADIVLLSTTYTNPKGGTSSKFKSLIQDAKRLNVALSRPKAKLIVFGNLDTIKNKKIFIDDAWTGYRLEDVFNKFEVIGRKKYENKDITPLNIIL